MGDLNVKAIAALGTAGLAWIVLIVAMATDYWVQDNLDVQGASAHIGLWKYCQERFGLKSCTDWLDGVLPLPDWLKGVQAVVCLDFIANLAALVCLGLFAFIQVLPGKLLKIGSMALLGVSAFFGVVAISVWAAESKSYFGDVYDLGWSWGLMIAVTILQLVSVGLTVISSRDD